MSLLTLINNACSILKISEADSVISSRDENIRQLLQCAREEIAFLVQRYEWAELRKFHVITLVSGAANYAAPLDLVKWLPGTRFNVTNAEEVVGALTSQQYQRQAAGGQNLAISGTQFRISNLVGGEVEIYPTPTAGNAGQTLSFMYQSKEATRPQSWMAGVPVLTNQYVWWANRKYFSASGNNAVTGTNPPVHTSGTVNDGGVLWTFDGTYIHPNFSTDLDETFLNEHLVYLGLKYRWLQANKYDFQVEFAQYSKYYDDAAGAKNAPSMVSLDGGYRRHDQFNNSVEVI